MLHWSQLLVDAIFVLSMKVMTNEKTHIQTVCAVCAYACKYDPSADPDALYFPFHASVLLCSTSHNFNLLNFDICEAAGSDCVFTAHINRGGTAQKSCKMHSEDLKVRLHPI